MATFATSFVVQQQLASLPLKQSYKRKGALLAAIMGLWPGPMPFAQAQTCTTTPVTPSVSVDTWNSSSGWLALTNNAALRPSITGVSVTVSSGGGAGNNIHVLENWNPAAVASKPLTGGTVFVPISASSAAKTLQFFIEHKTGSVLQAALTLCTGGVVVTPPPPPPPSGAIPIPALQFQPTGDTTRPTAKKSTLPPPGTLRADHFGAWPNAHLAPECVQSHDRYWVLGPDQRAYHTWHPVTETITLATGQSQLCAYGHEHGSDPSQSPAFAFFGGWPPFGYVAQQQGHTPNLPVHREEDHVGHKVNVATFNAALGDPQNAGSVIYDAGFSCHFISKIHQGTWSADVFPNHLHEYFLAVACNDRYAPDPNRVFTWLSVKRMAAFGEPNTFKKICPSYTDQPVTGMLDFNGATIVATSATTPTGVGNREFQCFNTDLQDKLPQELAQPELWTGGNTVQTGTGSVTFAPYYIVKNPSRLYDGAHRARHTIDYCYDANNRLLAKRHCSAAPSVKPDWNSTESPFKGTLRAVNFKSIQIYNGSNSEVCTDVFGQFAHVASAALPCNSAAGEIYQAVAPTFNEWATGKRCVNGHCDHVNGSLEHAIPDPNVPGRYIAPGIGFEHLEFHDHPTVRGQN